MKGHSEQMNPAFEQVKWSFQQATIFCQIYIVASYPQQVKGHFEQMNPAFEQVKWSFQQATTFYHID